jgi:glycosyltransferase involved in cell wall biosynthesis
VLHTRVVSGTGGGPDGTILRSAAALADTRYWLMAAFMHRPGDPGLAVLRQRAEAAGCPLIDVPDRGPFDPSVVATFSRLCRRLQVRVWHGHDYKSNLIGLLLRPFHPLKLVTTVHGWVRQTRRTPLYYAIDRWCLPRYGQVICVSDDLANQVRRLGVPPERCTTIQNGVDERTFRRRHPPVESPLRARLAVPPDRLVVGAVGRLSPEKGFDDLIRASAPLLTAGLDFEVWIVGDGPARPALERQIRAGGLEDRVRLLGFWPEPVELYHALDLFALSSRREGLPNVVLEALAMEVPVIATRVGGVPEIIGHGQTGLLCPPADPTALAAALRTLMADPSLRARLARAGRALVEREFSFSRRMQKERAIYDRVLGADRDATIQSEVLRA